MNPSSKAWKHFEHGLTGPLSKSEVSVDHLGFKANGAKDLS